MPLGSSLPSSVLQRATFILQLLLGVKAGAWVSETEKKQLGREDEEESVWIAAVMTKQGPTRS